MMSVVSTRLVRLFMGLCLLAASQSGLAQEFGNKLPGKQFGPPSLKGLGTFGAGATQDPVQVTAQVALAPSGQRGEISVTANVLAGYHVYSLTQSRLAIGGPEPSKLQVRPNSGFRLLGRFEPAQPPQTHVDQKAWPGLTLEEHEGQVTWVAPIELAAGIPLAELEIAGSLTALACDPNTCVPVSVQFTARVNESAQVLMPARLQTAAAAPVAKPTPWTEYQKTGSSGTLSMRLTSGSVAPGGSTMLEIRITPSGPWHTYAYAATDPAKGNKPTLIAFDRTAALTIGKPTTSSEVIEEQPPEFLKKKGYPPTRYHNGEVTWQVPISIPATAAAGSYPLSGFVGYQLCNEGGQCETPQAAKFDIQLAVGDSAPEASSAITLAEALYPDAARVAARSTGSGVSSPSSPAPVGSASPFPAPADVTPESALSAYQLEKIDLSEREDQSIWHYLLFAFVGGIILNLMPCVLPVIGLKVMSFVQQSGQDRSQAFLLNLWYSAGIMAVFAILAGLAILLNLGWGGQFGSLAFNAIMASIVFAMALSLLGVWEIPIPGFVGGSSAAQVAEKEGVLGAFTKGVFTTILATPCTGPFMATALGWAVQQPPATTFSVFLMLGLGMSAPYLVIGLFPSLVRFIPKPGNWMVTFKQVLGFVLLGTVVFILSYVDEAAVVPLVLLLTGIGFACWWISRTPVTAEFGERLSSWLSGVIITGVSAAIAFGWLYPEVTKSRLDQRLTSAADTQTAETLDSVLNTYQAAPAGADLRYAANAVLEEKRKLENRPWVDFSLERLARHAVNENDTVMVEFTANWCGNCKFLAATVLHTDKVEGAIQENGIVTMKADFTDYPPEIQQVLNALGSNGVPVVAIFPGNDPYRPIVFKDGYTRDGLLAAIAEAQSRGPGSGEVTTPQVAAASVR